MPSIDWCRSGPLALTLLVGLVADCSSSLEPVPLGWGAVRTYSTHRETDLGFRSSDGAVLAGTLLLPSASDRYPAVVMHSAVTAGAGRRSRMSPGGWPDLADAARSLGRGDPDAILARGDLTDYHLAHSARADLCRRLGRAGDARAAYQRALGLTRQEPERRFLQRRLGELPA